MTRTVSGVVCCPVLKLCADSWLDRDSDRCTEIDSVRMLLFRADDEMQFDPNSFMQTMQKMFGE